MKQFFILLLIYYPASSEVFSQDAICIDVPPGRRVSDVIKEKGFLYSSPSFTSGTITYKNGKTKTALLNFNTLLGEVQTLHNHDTIAIDENNVASVIFGTDSLERGVFYVPPKSRAFGNSVFNEFYFKVERDYGKMRLVSKKIFAIVKRTPLKDDATRFNLSFSTLGSGRFLKDIAPVDTLRLAFFDMFYIANVKNELMPVHRSSLIELYPDKEKAILDYVSRRTVFPYDKERVVALLDFVAQKQYNR